MTDKLRQLRAKLAVDLSKLYVKRAFLLQIIHGDERKSIQDWIDAQENVIVRKYDVERMGEEAERCSQDERGRATREYYQFTASKLLAEILEFEALVERSQTQLSSMLNELSLTDEVKKTLADS